MPKSIINILIIAVYAGGAFFGTAILTPQEAIAGPITQTYWSHHGDITGDGYTDVDDLAVIALNWLSTDIPTIHNYADLNGDDIVNNHELGILYENWGWEKPDGAVMKSLAQVSLEKTVSYSPRLTPTAGQRS